MFFGCRRVKDSLLRAHIFRNKNRTRALILALVALGVADVCHGRAFEVRLLKGDERNGTWGTDEFRVVVNPTGVLRNVTVHEKEIIWQAAALYTSPVASDGTSPRTVQGERWGQTGLSVEPPVMQAWADHGKRIFTFRHKVSNRKVYDGLPLCNVTQKMIITPTGEIHVSYDFEWLRTLRWNGFCLLVMFGKETIPGCEYLARVQDRFLGGRFTPGDGLNRLRLPLEKLTIRTPVGLVHFLWDTKTNCTLNWAKGVTLSMSPPAAPYKNVIYKGQRDSIVYRILLPVSQQ